jgi:LysR family transcriptional regulator, transcription activator of glutamate synthase operon
MGMDTDALRWFQQVADGTTVTEVSELEGVTQPGISRALARLEGEVGTPLLRKSGRTLRMTRAGVTFKRHVDAMLHQLDDGIAAISQLIDPDTGVVGLAFQHSLGTWLVPDLVRSFRSGHPGVRFALTQVRDELLSPVLDGAADLEIGMRRPRDPGLVSRLIAVEPLRVAVPLDDPRAARPGLTLASLAGEPFVAQRSGSAMRQLTDELCRQAGFRPDVVFEGDDLSTVRGFVAAGLGVAIVPAPRQGSPEAAAGPLRFCEITDLWAAREITVSWSADRRLLPAAEQFRQHVLARASAGEVPALTS